MAARIVPLAVFVAAGFYLVQAAALPFGSVERPGAGFYPVIVAAFACVVGLVATARAFLTTPGVAPTAAPQETVDPSARDRVVASVLALAGFCLVMPWIGYPLSALAFVAIVLRRLGSGWAPALAIAVLSAGTSYYLFAVLLDVPLPRGPW
jgi:putative tricarboxylic transport membrane protein